MAVEGGIEKDCPGCVTSQNDIADGLYWLADLIGGSVGDLLKRLADFFEGLDGDDPRVQNADCWAQFLTGIRDDAIENFGDLISDLLVRAQSFLDCFLGSNAQKNTIQTRKVVAEKIDVACIWDALTTYLRTRDIAATVMAFITCMIGNGGTPAPNPGGGGFYGRPVNRC